MASSYTEFSFDEVISSMVSLKLDIVGGGNEEFIIFSTIKLDK